MYTQVSLKKHLVYLYLEAMAAGLYCITTNYGALFETGAEFPMYIPYSQ